MDTRRLNQLIRDCTIMLRKGEIVREEDRDGIHVITIDAMEHADDAKDIPGLVTVDCELLVVGVIKENAERSRDEIVALLKDWPDPSRLAMGPSYIEVGAELGDQGQAFCLFALGEVLELWTVLTPSKMFRGIPEAKAREAAGLGYVMISGFQRFEKEETSCVSSATPPEPAST